jgi:hypothetical protein
MVRERLHVLRKWALAHRWYSGTVVLVLLVLAGIVNHLAVGGGLADAYWWAGPLGQLVALTLVAAVIAGVAKWAKRHD